LWLAFTYPLVALVVVALMTLVAVWLVPKLWRAVRGLMSRVQSWFGHAPRDPAPRIER